MDRLTAAGCTLATPRDDARRGPQVAIRSKDAAAMTERLAARGVVVSWRTEDVPRGSWRHRGAGPHPTTATAGF